MPPLKWLLYELGESYPFWRSKVIVDPSLALTDWGVFCLRRLSSGPFPAPYIAPTLARILHHQYDSQRDMAYLLHRDLGLDRKELKSSFDIWQRALRPDDGESPGQFFINIEEDGYRGTEKEREPTEEHELYRRTLSWLRTNVADGDHPMMKRLDSPAEQIFMEQVALGAALSGEGAHVLARCASEPWFWRYIKKKGFTNCKEITEETWLRDEIEEKKHWLRVRGLHQLAYAGFTFGFVHFMFPDPGLLKESVASALSAGWALYTDP